jgi:hypothetical protein
VRQIGALVSVNISSAPVYFKVSGIVSERLNVGSYKVRFDGKRLGSGVYLYKLQAGSFKQTKKLVITK